MAISVLCVRVPGSGIGGQSDYFVFFPLTSWPFLSFVSVVSFCRGPVVLCSFAVLSGVTVYRCSCHRLASLFTFLFYFQPGALCVVAWLASRVQFGRWSHVLHRCIIVSVLK